MTRVRAALLLLIALVLALSGAWLATSTGSPAEQGPQPKDGTLLHWSTKHGTVTLVTIGDKADKLPGAPASFRRFARSEMRDTWQGYLDGRPACKGVPHITVRALRTDGFAMGDVSEHPAPGCQDGGGYVAIWAVRKGEWREVIGTQDIPTCARLQKFDIPSEIGVDQCYDGTGVVDYVHS